MGGVLYLGDWGIISTGKRVYIWWLENLGQNPGTSTFQLCGFGQIS